MSLPAAKVNALKEFVGLLESQPDLLHTPQLAFFKSYLVNLGAKVPEPKKKEL